MNGSAETKSKSSHKEPTGIICVGCERDSSEIAEYTEEMPVEEDGTYANKKVVCTSCYIELVFRGQDVGTPEEIQQRMQYLRDNPSNP